jgi:N-acetylneuraminic acid mutarotase
MKKLLLIFIFFPIVSFAQNWEFMGYYPSEGRHHPVTFSSDKFGYVIAGQNADGQYLNDVLRYDSQNNIWEQLSNFPGLARGYAYGVSDSLFAYIGFGSNNSLYPTDWWRYDMINDVWYELASFPDIGRNHPAMILSDNKIFVGMGSDDDGNMSDWWEYDILVDQWNEKTEFTFGARHHPFYFSIDNIPFVGFGHGDTQNDNIQIYNDFYRYNIDSESWTQLNDFPSEARVAGTQFSYNGKGYVMSGDGDDHGPLDSGEVWEYDPDSDSWTALVSHPGGARWAPGSFVIDCSVYLTSGFESQSDTYYNDLLKLQLSQDCGCTDDAAFNYDLEALINDNSCCYVSGCTNPNSINFDILACLDDASCIPYVLGCNDIESYNYNPLANTSTVFTGPDYNELGSGGFHYNDEWDMVFNCNESVTIKTIDLYSESSFSTQIEVLDINNNQIHFANISLQSGLNQISLDFLIPQGNNYKIGINGDNQGLYRNSSVVSNVFPINLLNVLEITSNTTDNPLDYFYYFYNWQLEIACNNLIGCIDETACNYNNLANEDDGSCSYAQEFFDCDGNCINDIDNDEECDEVDYDDAVGVDEIGGRSNQLIRMIDVLGREYKEHKLGTLLFYIYDNGKIERKVIY